MHMYSENHRRHRVRYAVIATAVLSIGLAISLQAGGTWWLLLLAAMAWVQTLVFRREIMTSGLPLRLFSTVAWALLGFALVSLLPDPGRLIGDVLVLLVAVASFLVGPHLRRVRR